MSMEVFDRNQIVDAICKGEINFIGSCVTPWHANGIDSAISYLQAQGVEVKGAIILKYAIKESEITCILNGTHFVNSCCRYYVASKDFSYTMGSLLKDNLNVYRGVSWYNSQSFDASRPVLYIANPWHVDVWLFQKLYPFLKDECSIRLMMVEEGLATYFACNTGVKRCWEMSARHKGLRRVLSFLLHSYGQYALNRFEQKTDWINLNLLRKERDGALKPNREAHRFYKKVLDEHVSRLSLNASLPELSGAVVICTMAYLRNEIKDFTDVKTLKQVVDAAKEKGLKVYLKPHPREVDYRERYASLGCELLTASCSMEVLMAHCPTLRALVSFTSTSLVTANLIFGIKAISLIGMIEGEKYGSYFHGEIASFRQSFAPFVEMPVDEEELLEII